MSTPRTDAEKETAYFAYFGGWADVTTATFARQLETELAAANARIAELESFVKDPIRLHAHCVRTLTNAQVAHLFGERMTEIQNRCSALESQLESHAWTISPAMAQATIDAQAKRIAELEKDKQLFRAALVRIAWMTMSKALSYDHAFRQCREIADKAIRVHDGDCEP